MSTGGPAFPGTLLDWFAGQALVGFLVYPYGSLCAQGIEKAAYDYAEAMLAEKARRESDHSGDANKMVELEARNRELVQALSAMEMWVPTHCENQAVAAARAVLEKAKEAKP